MTSSAVEAGRADADVDNPYACSIAESETQAGDRCSTREIASGLVLAGFAGVLGLFLGPMLALAILATLSGGKIPGLDTPGGSLLGWTLVVSLFFSPMLAVLTFREHLKSARDRRLRGTPRSQ